MAITTFTITVTREDGWKKLVTGGTDEVVVSWRSTDGIELFIKEDDDTAPSEDERGHFFKELKFMDRQTIGDDSALYGRIKSLSYDEIEVTITGDGTIQSTE